MKFLSSRLKYFALVGILLGLGNVPSADASSRSFVYWAKKIPASNQNCHEQAKALAERFTQITGLSASGRCESITQKGNDLSIRYESSIPLQVMTTVTEIGFPGQGYEFSTQAQCESKIPEEVEVFRKITGNEPLLKFCRGQENYYGLVRWALVVEGFGNSDKKSSWASSLFPGQPPRGLVEKIKNETQLEFSDAVTNIRHVFIQDDEHGHLRFTVNYYGKFDEQIKAFSLASVNNLSECEEAQSEMQRVKSQSQQIKTLSYCVANPYHRGADLVAVVDVTRWYETRQAAETFSSYEACAIEKENIIKIYQTNYSEKVLGGFCTKWGSHWKINLLEVRS